MRTIEAPKDKKEQMEEKSINNRKNVPSDENELVDMKGSLIPRQE